MPVAENLTGKSLLSAGVAALALSTLALTGCTAGSASQEQRSDTYGGAFTTVTLDLDDAGAKQLGVTTASLSALVIGSDRDDIEIRRTLEFTDGDKPEESIDTDASGPTISTRCPDRFAVGSPTCVARYEIAVPYGTVIHGNSKFGDLTVRDTRAAVDLNSRYGDVALVVGSGSYAVDAVSATGSSTVEVPQDPAGIPVRLRSGDGSVSATTSIG